MADDIALAEAVNKALDHVETARYHVLEVADLLGEMDPMPYRPAITIMQVCNKLTLVEKALEAVKVAGL